MIAIKDREMPKNCAGCFLRVGQCSKRIYMENRPSDCPLNEIPEPHGRLIDADKFKEEFPHDEDWDYPVNTNSYVVETIDKSPTIIEAEEDE